MGEQDLNRLREILVRQRQEIFARHEGLEADWQALSERDIEREEEAQKADLTALFDQLEGREKEEIEEIDVALTKIASATYGICEKCRQPIPLQRLEALPATRFCKKCAGAAEKK